MLIKTLKRSFKSREHIQRREHWPYFEISAIQAFISDHDNMWWRKPEKREL